MSYKELNHESLKYALIGGAILGGGGGGSIKGGSEVGETALKIGTPKLVNIDDLHDNDIVITVSGVGAPAAELKYATSDDYINTVKNLIDTAGLKVGGIITNENGGSATINGWVQSVSLGIPLVDAPCNGRAHPTGVMGSMGLHNLENYETHQSISGGNPALGLHIEGVLKGKLDTTAALVRQCAVQAGGVVAVARNPVSKKYVKENAALGAISQAIDLGEAFYKGLETSPVEAVKEVVTFLGGEIVEVGKVEDFILKTEGGFDVGKFYVNNYELTFWNEYMTLEKESNRLGTFPDLVMTFDKETGYPVTTAELKENQEIIIINVAKENIKLGITMKQPELFEVVEKIIEKEVVKYV